jgi:hypothetical protein
VVETASVGDPLEKTRLNRPVILITLSALARRHALYYTGRRRRHRGTGGR